MNLKRFTDEQMFRHGFERVTGLNPRPRYRADFAFRSASLLLTVWPAGSSSAGELVFDYPGGNVFIKDEAHLSSLVSFLKLGHEAMKANQQ